VVLRRQTPGFRISKKASRKGPKHTQKEDATVFLVPKLLVFVFSQLRIVSLKPDSVLWLPCGIHGICTCRMRRGVGSLDWTGHGAVGIQQVVVVRAET